MPIYNSIKHVSFTLLDNYRECPKRVKLDKIDKLPKPPDDYFSPPGMKEHPLERGSRIHKEAEDFVVGATDTVTKDLNLYKDELSKARAMYEVEKATAEEMWTFEVTNDWNFTEEKFPRDIAFRYKCDLFAIHYGDPQRGLMVDYKTGKRDRKAHSHDTQVQYGGALAFRAYDGIAHVTSELWYFDLPMQPVVKFTMTKAQSMVIFNKLQREVEEVITTREFPARPSPQACRYCPFAAVLSEHGLTEPLCSDAITADSRNVRRIR